LQLQKIYEKIKKGGLMEIRKIVGADSETVKEKLTSALKKLGYDFRVFPKGAGFEIRNIRLSDGYVKKYGYNFSPYTGRRGRILGWQNWVEVNNTANIILDKLHAGANIKSLGGKFKIRIGTTALTESDWEEKGYENVGSMVEPVTRKEAWQPEKELGRWKAKKLAEII
jgi:hypothetical protein